MNWLCVLLFFVNVVALIVWLMRTSEWNERMRR